ncbi:MAG: carotenoid biosynthesis protein [Ilumatobacteraceae bacterium]|nr:carotenoid biosynthesis protein [Ilumatobacteraceae bacterium]
MTVTTPWAQRVAAAAGAVTAAAMIATPLCRKGGRARQLLSTVVVTGSFTTTLANAVDRWGWQRAAVAAAATTVATTGVERIGSTTGVPFGRYHYTGTLRPTVGDVPVIVPLAWFALGLPAREVADSLTTTPLQRVAVGASALTAWDAFLDPQMVGEGYWRWPNGGTYRGIPVSNFVGWWATSAGLMALFDALLPPLSSGPSRPLVAEYSFMAVMETLGFAAFFRDRVVAAVGGAAMMPLAAAAVGRIVRG